jgi:3-hydroxyacyl-CoA dehydrogenase/enoyl-CoA hydratase/3-hydroxybutyryl-CoA epimerase
MINSRIEKEVMVVEFDQEDSKANVLNMDFFEGLNKALFEAEGSDNLKGIIFLSKKPSIYLAGADLVSMEANLEDEKWLRGVLRLGQETFNRIERLQIPTVAAIHGACLGGGLELALACDYRIASTEKSTKLGLPEVMLGILPAWGGTTRLPKIIGVTKALSCILTGKPYAAKKAKKLGLVDELCHKENMLSIALNKCLGKKKIKKKKSNKIINAIALLPATIIAKRGVIKKTKGNYPAPIKIIDTIRKSFFCGRDEALELEKKAFVELAGGSVCKNLIRIFFLQERSKKKPPVIDVPSIKNVAVLGAGTMGAGIAQWVLSRGRNVMLKDISEKFIAKGLKSIGKLFIEAVLRKKMDRPSVRAHLGRLTPETQDVSLKDKDLIIEAVVESLKIKSDLLKKTEAQMNKDAILATNTSAISITELAKGLDRPENFIGIHFFNPVHKMQLVEIVVGDMTSQGTIDRAINFVQEIGKLPVVVKDSPGFLVNRILLPYLIESIRLFSEGHSMDSIDKEMVKFGMPMGPLRLLDEIGLDVASHVALDLEKRLSQFSTPAILKEILLTGDLGKKSGKGFYVYKEGRKICPNPRFEALQKNLPKQGSPKERMVKAMTEEAEKCLKEAVAQSYDDIDFAMIMGTGWAPFRGGPMRYSGFGINLIE